MGLHIGVEVDLQDMPGAWPAGTRVRKVRSEPDDIMPNGALGTVLGSMGPCPPTPEVPAWLHGVFAYAVEWDGSALPPSFVIGPKLERL